MTKLDILEEFPGRRLPEEVRSWEEGAGWVGNRGYHSLVCTAAHKCETSSHPPSDASRLFYRSSVLRPEIGQHF